MRVKVQYTADLEDIPKEVAKLLPKLPDFTPEVADIEEMVMGGEILKSIDKIDELRKLLFRTDQRLSDSQQILRGYLGVITSPPTEANGVENDSAS